MVLVRIKLTHNGDHYPSESFKIAYVCSRVSGEPLKHVSFRRGSRSRSYTGVNDMIDHLSDLYEITLTLVKDDHSRVYSKLKQ